MKTTNAFLIAVATLAFGAPVSAADGGNADNGKQLYMRDGCYECHTTVGMGGGNAGPKIAPNPIPLEGIVAELRHPRQNMPQYSEAVISDAEIADIRAYLATIPDGPHAKDIPELNR
jgi:mono/diheme cytochrome c family protein